MIKFKVEMDDIIAFNQHFVLSSPVCRANRKRTVTICASIFASVALLQAFSLKSFVPLVLWTVITTLFCFWIYRLTGKVSAKRIRRLYSADKDKLVLCEHEMDNLPDGFVDKTPLCEQKAKFPAIVQIDETPSHIFIFTGSMQAHIIPKGKVSEGDFGKFVALLREGVLKAKQSFSSQGEIR